MPFVGKVVGKVNRPYITRTRKHLSCSMSLKNFYKKEAWRPSSKHYAYGLCPIAKTKRALDGYDSSE